MPKPSRKKSSNKRALKPNHASLEVERPKKRCKSAGDQLTSTTLPSKPSKTANPLASMPYAGDLEKLYDHGFLYVPRVKHPPDAPFEIFSLLHNCFEVVFLTISIPHTYPKTKAIKFKVETNITSIIAASRTVQQNIDLQKRLSNLCHMNPAPVSLFDLGIIWKNLLCSHTSPVLLDHPTTELIALFKTHFPVRVITSNKIEVYITDQKGDPLIKNHEDYKHPNCSGQLVWNFYQDPDIQQSYPKTIQDGLNHVLYDILQVFPLGGSRNSQIHVAVQFFQKHTFGLYHCSLELGLLIHRNLTMGDSYQMSCNHASTEGKITPFLLPNEDRLQYPDLSYTQTKNFNLLKWNKPETSMRPGWLTEEEFASKAKKLVLLEPTDERYQLMTAGLPMGWRVHEVKLVIQPKERKMFAAALDVEQVTDYDKDVLLCWHGAPKHAAIGIINDGPNTALSGFNSKFSSYGPGMYFTRKCEISLLKTYSPPDQDNMKYLIKCAVIGNKPQVNQRGTLKVIPGDKNCFTNREVDPYIIVHQRPSYILVLGMIVVSSQ